MIDEMYAEHTAKTEAQTRFWKALHILKTTQTRIAEYFGGVIGKEITSVQQHSTGETGEDFGRGFLLFDRLCISPLLLGRQTQGQEC